MIVIDGYTPDDKVPGAVAQNIYAAGKLSIGAIPLTCVLFGNKVTAGVLANATKATCGSVEEAATLAGDRSELANMAYAALDVPGVTLALVPVAEAGSAAAATSTLTIACTWSTSGEFTIQLDDIIIRVGVNTSMTTATFFENPFLTGVNIP